MCNAATAGSRPVMNGICPLLNTPDHKLLPNLPEISCLKSYFLRTKLYDNHDICVVELEMLIGSFQFFNGFDTFSRTIDTYAENYKKTTIFINSQKNAVTNCHDCDW